jgi:hypothetical protein
MHLPRLDVLSCGDLEYDLRCFHIGVVVLALVAWIGPSKITFRIRFRALDLAGQKAPAKGREGHEADRGYL